MKKLNIISGGVLVLAVAIIAASVVISHHHKSPAKAIPKVPCSTAKDPCIELNDAHNHWTGIKFNDFQFGPPGCIYYRMTLGDKFKEYCGGYNMIWIGHGAPSGVEGKS